MDRSGPPYVPFSSRLSRRPRGELRTPTGYDARVCSPTDWAWGFLTAAVGVAMAEPVGLLQRPLRTLEIVVTLHAVHPPGAMTA